MKYQVNLTHNGFAIAVAWPETLCKLSGSWYDWICGLLGISKNHYYRVGHAALILVNRKDRKCHYFDFGRYHAPYQHGRVRNEITDHGLKISTHAKISADGIRIDNIEEIMTELQNNAECHGDGAIYASYCFVNFEMAYNKAMQLQKDSPIPYGPFDYRGTNCSRFVNTCILAGMPEKKYRFRLKFFIPFTPTPLNNVNALDNKRSIPITREDEPFFPQPLNDRSKLISTLSEPARPASLPQNAKWLSGEGAGSWFLIEEAGDNYLICRFGPSGNLECKNIFSIINNQSFLINKPFNLEYGSHCQKVRINQSDKIIELISIPSTYW